MVPATVVAVLPADGWHKVASGSFRILAMLLRPDGGQADVCGYDVLREARQVRQLIGLAGQRACAD